MIDCGFPVIKYERGQTPRQWGQAHGEQFREAIAELVEIRTRLMQHLNPGLTADRIESLAIQQWECTIAFDSSLTDELRGIAEGSGVSIPQLVVLNNYTDFRDIQLEEEGCSLVYTDSEKHGPVVGQTWDMHRSAKQFVSCIDYPLDDDRAIVFSAVGCVGMMGFTSRGTALGVNNIFTDGAEPGVLWPVLVRAVLQQPDLEAMIDCLTAAQVTSGHNYLLADQNRAQMWETAPRLAERVAALDSGEFGFMFHTNHCLGQQMRARQTKVSKTSPVRYRLLQQKAPGVQSIDEMDALMNDHENYPMSICSNYLSDSPDPPVTCGGAVGNLNTGEVRMWRGDEIHDANFVKHEFALK